MLFKNVASQKVPVFAYDTLNDAPKTGDAANITAQISKDGAACAPTNDTNPTELDSSNAKGVYIFDMTQSEMNGDMIVISPVSSTTGIKLDPVFLYPFAQGLKIYDLGVLHGSAKTGTLSTTVNTVTITTLNPTDAYLNDAWIVYTSGALRGLGRKITSNSSSSGADTTLNFSGVSGDADAAWPTAPSNGDTFIILGHGGD